MISYFIFSEHIPTAIARVEALKSHGFSREAIRLAVAIVRTMKCNQLIAQSQWKKHQNSVYKECSIQEGVAKRPGYASWEGWIGHSLNPIGCLFDTLAEACLSQDERHQLPHHLEALTTKEETSSSTVLSSQSVTTLHYRHTPIAGSQNRRETYLTLAMESALIGLGQQRVMPSGLYAQEKACKQEERLITRLQEIDLDSALVSVLCYQANLLMDMGPSSGIGIGIHPESVPMQTFAKYLFTSIFPFDSDLAFNIGLRALRLPVLDGLTEESLSRHNHGMEADAGRGSNFAGNRLPKWFTLAHIESQQCSLASLMLTVAKGT